MLTPPPYWPHYDPELYPPEEYPEFFYFDDEGTPLGFRDEEEVEEFLDEIPLARLLPQTGMLWWPVPVLAGIGLLLLTVGMARRKREDDR